MKPRIMYIEQASYNMHRGDAWIGKVTFSKTGQTVYFNGKALKKMKRGSFLANYCDIESGEAYWISGVKKNGQDRHWAGGGKIMIDRSIVGEYLRMVDFETLDEGSFELVDLQPTDKQAFVAIENQRLSEG